jgi:hypothetical protein
MGSGKAAMSASAWGNAPGKQFIPDGQALKARLSSGSVKRAFSSGVLHSHNPGALPQVRHGESVLWWTWR